MTFLNLLEIPKNFLKEETFIFKFKNKNVMSTQFISNTISPIICLIHKSDPFYNLFEFDYEEKDNTFDLIINKCFGDSIIFEDYNLVFNILSDLGNF